YGRVSKYGVFPLSWTLDHCGPLTRSVEDAALTLQVLAGHDARDPSSAAVPVADYTADLERGVGNLRVGVPRHTFQNSPLASAAFLEAMSNT
ncbi:amidase family protein, partial [Colwellia marinimaniae]|uniref:amidase family protein n=1 Tax=Colwellia marinimaniae TaxID=1513592 RepID=UPI002285AC78